MTTPQDPGDREQPASFPSAPPPPEQQNPYAAPQQPYQGQGQNPYSAQPLGAHELNPQSAVRPKDVDTSFLLWVAAIVLGLVSVILSFVLIDNSALEDARRQLQTQGGNFTQEQLDSIVTTAKVAGAVFLVIIYGLWLMFVLFMRSGKNWARIVLAVLSGLWLVSTLFGLAGSNAIGLVLDLVQVVLVVAAVYFMFRPAANAYFTPRRVG